MNCNENENDYGKIDHINKTNRPRRRYRDKYIENMACLGKTMPLCNEQHFSNIWVSIHQKAKQHWGWVEKKALLIKKACKSSIKNKNKVLILFEIKNTEILNS